MDIGDVDQKAIKVVVNIDDQLKISDITTKLLVNVTSQKKKEWANLFCKEIFTQKTTLFNSKKPFLFLSMLTQFIVSLFEVYMDLHFTYLEINQIVVTDNHVYILDLASKIDQTADYLCKTKWGDIDFPPPFGREAYPEVNIYFKFFKFYYDFSCSNEVKSFKIHRVLKLWPILDPNACDALRHQEMLRILIKAFKVFSFVSFKFFCNWNFLIRILNNLNY